MKKLEQIQSRKMMSAYGGVGSIIETKDNGSLIIAPFNQWICYQPKVMKKYAPSEIKDPRLLNFLQKEVLSKAMPGISHIYRIPTYDLSEKISKASKGDLFATIKSEYFPMWYYCPHCRRLHRLSDWENLWINKFPNDRNGFKKNEPSCPYCSYPKGRGIHRQKLQQVRFVLVSADQGNIKDVPFESIWNAQVNGEVFLMDGAQAVTDELYYLTSSNSDGLQAISVRRGSNSGAERKSMSFLASKYFVIDGGAYKLFLKDENNIYYPDVIHSLYIPLQPTVNDTIIAAHKKGMSVDLIYASQALLGTQLSKDEIQFIIDNDAVNYDQQEYNYITYEANYRGGTNFQDRNFRIKRYPNLKAPFIKQLYAIPTLKITSVEPSYSRIAPESDQIKWYDVNAGTVRDIFPKKVYTFDDHSIDYLPGVESYGEGIFIDVDMNGIPEKDSGIFVHTLSHMIMKELEFQCGYPLTSMKEKLYWLNQGRNCGILIYALGGSEGSYGGLISLFPNKTTESTAPFLSILKSAFQRVYDCPNDPICSEENGHCFACLDIPEISCCKWNKELDRRVFIKYFDKLHDSYQDDVKAKSSDDNTDNKVEISGIEDVLTSNADDDPVLDI